jgi:hypothetical protein
MNVEGSDISSFFDDDQDSDDEDSLFGSDPLSSDQYKVFACQHTYHIRCLLKLYRRKCSPPELQAMFSLHGAQRLKCLLCSIANFELQEGKTPGVRRGVIGPPNRIVSKRDNLYDIQEYWQQLERRAMRKATFRETIAQSSKFEMVSKKM